MNWGTGAAKVRSTVRGGARGGSLIQALVLLSAACAACWRGSRGNDRRRAGQGLSQQPRHQSAARRGARADENVPKANAGYLPTVTRRAPRRRRAISERRLVRLNGTPHQRERP